MGAEIDAYDVVFWTIIERKCYELGICSLAHTQEQIRDILAQLPPDEARKMKRRFRKLWRQEKKKLKGRQGSNYGMPGTRPNSTQAFRRRHLVKLLCIEPYSESLNDLYTKIHGTAPW